MRRSGAGAKEQRGERLGYRLVLDYDKGWRQGV
jgi:hypothetical protein